MSEELVRIANALERIADFYERGLHVDIDHAHIDDIGEIHGDVTTHPKKFYIGQSFIIKKWRLREQQVSHQVEHLCQSMM